MGLSMNWAKTLTGELLLFPMEMTPTVVLLIRVGLLSDELSLENLLLLSCSFSFLFSLLLELSRLYKESFLE